MIFRDDLIRKHPSSHSKPRGFTLIELLVGIGVSSILIIGLFQLLSDLSILREQFQSASIASHQRVALNRFFSQDLLGSPRTEPEFEGASKEFYRTVPIYDPNKNMTLETRVHYYVESTQKEQHLKREIKWVDLNDRYHSKITLLRADYITLSYRAENGEWQNRTASGDAKTIALKVEWDDNGIVFPVTNKKSDSEDDDDLPGAQPGT